MLIGYSRVSTDDQDTDAQTASLRKAGCERVFTEKASGGRWDRPELAKALEQLRAGDVLVVWKLDRLGRSLVEMMRTIDKLRADGIKFRSLTEELDSESAQGRFFLQIHGAMAEYFLDLNRERTMEGLKAALARGRKGGRRPKLTEDDKKAARAMLAAGDISVAEIARRLGISRVTFYDYFPQARAKAQEGKL